MSDTANIVGVDPHRKTFTATILDPAGRVIEHRSFANEPSGHADVMAWAGAFGTIDRWGGEGASGLGRHLAEALIASGADVRDVPPHRTAQRQRGRHEGKTDRLDSHRVADQPAAGLRVQALPSERTRPRPGADRLVA